MASYSPRPVSQNRLGQYIDQYGKVINTNYTPSPIGQTRSGSYVYADDAGVPPVVARERARQRAAQEQQSSNVEVRTQANPIRSMIQPVISGLSSSRPINTASALASSQAIQGQQELTRSGMENARKQFEEQRRVENVGVRPLPGEPPLTKMDMQIREITNLNVGNPNFETVSGESISVDANGNRVVNFKSATSTLPQANVDHPNGEIPQLGENGLVGNVKGEYSRVLPNPSQGLLGAQRIVEARDEGRLTTKTEGDSTTYLITPKELPARFDRSGNVEQSSAAGTFRAQAPYTLVDTVASAFTGEQSILLSEKSRASFASGDTIGAAGLGLAAGASGVAALPFSIVEAGKQSRVLINQGKPVEGFFELFRPSIGGIVEGGKTLVGSPQGALLLGSSLVGGAALSVGAAKVGAKATQISAPRVANIISELSPADVQVKSITYRKGTTITGTVYDEFSPLTRTTTAFDIRANANVKGFGVPKGTNIVASGAGEAIETFINGESKGVNVFAQGRTTANTLQGGKPIQISSDFGSVSQVAQGEGGVFNIMSKGVSGGEAFSARLSGQSVNPGYDLYFGEVRGVKGGRSVIAGSAAAIGKVNILDVRNMQFRIKTNEFFPEAFKVRGKFFATQESVLGRTQLTKFVRLKQGSNVDIFKTVTERIATDIERAPRVRYYAPNVNVELVPFVKPFVELKPFAPTKPMTPFAPEHISKLLKESGQPVPRNIQKIVNDRGSSSNTFMVQPTGKTFANFAVTIPKIDFFKTTSKVAPQSVIDSALTAGARTGTQTVLGARATQIQKTAITQQLLRFSPSSTIMFPVVPRVQSVSFVRFETKSRFAQATSQISLTKIQPALIFDSQTTQKTSFMPKFAPPLYVPRFRFTFIEKPVTDNPVKMGTITDIGTPFKPQITIPFIGSPPLTFPPVFPFILPGGGGSPPGGTSSPFFSSGGVKGKKRKIKKQSFLPTEPFTSFALFRGERIQAPSQKVLKQYYQAGVARPTVQGIKQGFTLFGNKGTIARSVKPMKQKSIKQFSSGFKKGGYKEFNSVVFGGHKRKMKG